MRQSYKRSVRKNVFQHIKSMYQAIRSRRRRNHDGQCMQSTPLDRVHACQQDLPEDVNTLIKKSADANQFEDETYGESFAVSFINQALFFDVPTEVLQFVILDLQRNKLLSRYTDKNRRRPLHFAVEYICNKQVTIEDGIKIIDALYRVDPSMIHFSDVRLESPLDITQTFRVAASKSSKEYEDLEELYSKLKEMSKAFYKLKKSHWEENKELKFTFIPTHRSGSQTSVGISSLDVLNPIWSTSSTISSPSDVTSLERDTNSSSSL